MNITIPADMNQQETAEAFGAAAAVSIRDLMVLLGATDEELRDSDERSDILAREPWRKDGLKFTPFQPGGSVGWLEGTVDWSGTRFADGK